MKNGKWGILIGLIALTSQAYAQTALNIGDSRDLGSIQYVIMPRQLDLAAFVNELTSLAPGTADFFDPVTGQRYNRTSSLFGSPYPTAELALNSSDTNRIIDLGSSSYEYLYGKYGPGGGEVWNVSGLTGQLILPPTGFSAQDHAFSGWALFNGAPIPEPSTVSLFALGAFGLTTAIKKRRSARS